MKRIAARSTVGLVILAAALAPAPALAGPFGSTGIGVGGKGSEYRVGARIADREYRQDMRRPAAQRAYDYLRTSACQWTGGSQWSPPEWCTGSSVIVSS